MKDVIQVKDPWFPSAMIYKDYHFICLNTIHPLQ